MDAYTLDLLNLGLRWFHIIAGIAWIGSSFYFIWLDASLTAPVPGRDRVEGELWMTHSGGFYRVEKLLLGMGNVPKTLHWFKWEAAFTWLSGVPLLAVGYYLTDGVYLFGNDIHLFSIGFAALATTIFIGLVWAIYDLLWRRPRDGKQSAIAYGLSLGLLAITMAVFFRFLGARAAFIHCGATLGTLMVANVWMRILPAQRQMIRATDLGLPHDQQLANRAKQRSVHNSYMTLPVVVMMISPHYPVLYQKGALALGLVFVLGAAVRHAMIARLRQKNAWLAYALSGCAVIGLVVATVPQRPTARTAGTVSWSRVAAVLTERCIPCHSAQPSDAAFVVAPNGMRFDASEAEVRPFAARIKARVTELKDMPLGNKTGITEQERELLGQWADSVLSTLSK